MNFFPNFPNNYYNDGNMFMDNNVLNDIFNKFNEYDNRIKKLEQRITRLEMVDNKNTIDEPDTSLYMI